VREIAREKDQVGLRAQTIDRLDRAFECGGAEGVGRALATEIGLFARRQGIRRVVIKTFARNESALAFWQRIGFRPRMVQMVADARRLSGGAT